MIKMRSAISFKKTTVIHFLIVSIFIGYLLSANYIFGRVLTVNGEAQLVKIPQVPEGQRVNFIIDELKENRIKWKEMIEVTGWGFIEGIPSRKDNEIFLVFASDDKQFAFNTNLLTRPDVTKYFKDLKLNLDYTGYRTNIAKDAIPDGNYKIGLFIKNNNTEALTYSKNILVKSDGTVKLKTNR